MDTQSAPHSLPADLGTIPEVAERIGLVAARTIRGWKDGGKVGHYRIGGRVYVSEAEVRAALITRVEPTAGASS